MYIEVTLIYSYYHPATNSPNLKKGILQSYLNSVTLCAVSNAGVSPPNMGELNNCLSPI